MHQLRSGAYNSSLVRSTKKSKFMLTSYPKRLLSLTWLIRLSMTCRTRWINFAVSKEAFKANLKDSCEAKTQKRLLQTTSTDQSTTSSSNSCKTIASRWIDTETSSTRLNSLLKTITDLNYQIVKNSNSYRPQKLITGYHRLKRKCLNKQAKLRVVVHPPLDLLRLLSKMTCSNRSEEIDQLPVLWPNGLKALSTQETAKKFSLEAVTVSHEISRLRKITQTSLAIWQSRSKERSISS